MVMNPQYEISRALSTALKAKAKIVGIPIPGHAPLAFERTRLQRMLRGVRPYSIVVDILDSDRFLCVKGVANGSVRTSCRVRAIPRHEALRMIECREKTLDRLTRPKATKHDAMIRRLEKEIGHAPRIDPPGFSWRFASAPTRETWLYWRAQKQERTQAFREALAEYRGDMVMARINCHHGLYRPGKSPYSHEYDVTPKWGPGRYLSYLTWRKETAHLREQIDAVRQLKAEAGQ